MTRLNRSGLLVGAALLAGLSATAASAFPAGSINWSWDLAINTQVDIQQSLDLGSANAAIVEQEQVFVGSTLATATAVATVPLLGLNAVTPPEVVADATAVNNNMALSSDGALMADTTQLTYGGLALGASVDLLSLASIDLDLLTPASVDAIASAGGTDSIIDSNATAVANNLTLEAGAFSISNGKQFAVANVTATSTSTGASLLVNSFNGPWVSATSTAVGNNVTVKVAAPVI